MDSFIQLNSQYYLNRDVNASKEEDIEQLKEALSLSCEQGFMPTEVFMREYLRGNSKTRDEFQIIVNNSDYEDYSDPLVNLSKSDSLFVFCLVMSNQIEDDETVVKYFETIEESFLMEQIAKITTVICYNTLVDYFIGTFLAKRALKSPALIDFLLIFEDISGFTSILYKMIYLSSEEDQELIKTIAVKYFDLSELYREGFMKYIYDNIDYMSRRRAALVFELVKIEKPLAIKMLVNAARSPAPPREDYNCVEAATNIAREIIRDNIFSSMDELFQSVINFPSSYSITILKGIFQAAEWKIDFKQLLQIAVLSNSVHVVEYLNSLLSGV